MPLYLCQAVQYADAGEDPTRGSGIAGTNDKRLPGTAKATCCVCHPIRNPPYRSLRAILSGQGFFWRGNFVCFPERVHGAHMHAIRMQRLKIGNWVGTREGPWKQEGGLDTSNASGLWVSASMGRSSSQISCAEPGGKKRRARRARATSWSLSWLVDRGPAARC